MLKKVALSLIGAVSVFVGLISLPTDKMVYGIFYIILGAIIAGYAFALAKEQKNLLIASAFIALFLTIGTQLVIDNNIIYGITCVIIGLVIIFKERASFAKQIKKLLG